MNTFSQRHGLAQPDAEITVRHEAPDWLRDVVISLAYEEAKMKPSTLRSFLCRLLLCSADRSNWSEFPNIDQEVRGLLGDANWFHVYDLIEWVYRCLIGQGEGVEYGFYAEHAALAFQTAINDCFRRKGVGWQMVDGLIQVRGPEVFEHAVREAVALTANTSREVAHREFQEALRDLSRRPEPEITGAIQHAMAALECVAKDVTRDPNLTLGKWMKKNSAAFPKPLDEVIHALWGFSSQYGRHVIEGKPTSFEEAELVVGLAGTLSVYLLRKG
ncbi:MAG: hypothetical protein R3F13_14060 [Prosthecobacter sp.]